MKLRNIYYIFIATFFILLIPFLAMQFTDQVKWGLGDFIVMGILLLSVGLGFELIVKRMKKHRAIAVIILLLAFFFIWAQLAVGVFSNLGS